MEEQVFTNFGSCDQVFNSKQPEQSPFTATFGEQNDNGK